MGRRDHAPLTVPADSAPSPGYFAHVGRALGAGVLLLALVAVAAAVIPNGPLAIDAHWSELMTDIRSPALDWIARGFNAAGRGLLRAGTIAAVGGVLIAMRRWAAVVAFALTESLAPLLSTVIKGLVERPRPPGALIQPNGFSFPSGHATYAGATSVALVLLTAAPGGRRPVAWWAAGLATAGMAWSRCYLQVHWLSDVVAGSLLGIGVALLVFALLDARATERQRLARLPRRTPRLPRRVSERSGVGRSFV